MGYRYDFFVSYRRSFAHSSGVRETKVGQWVQRIFVPELEGWWNESGSKQSEQSVFLDVAAVPLGAQWPDSIREALRDSRCLISVFSPPYFKSDWCCAEWQSMRLREDLLKIDRARQPGLVVPVTFHDGESFPAQARTTQWADFRPFSYMTVGNVGTDEGTPFQKFFVQKFMPELEKTIQAVPPWQPDFPIAPLPIIVDPPAARFPGMA